MVKGKVCFVYWDPHKTHSAWAESINAKFYSFAPFNSKFIKSNGLLLHFFAFLKAFFSLPLVDVYLMESPMMITAVLCRTLFSKKRKVISINSDPFLWLLPKYNLFSRNIAKLLIKRIDGYLSTSNMMDSLAAKTKKPHEIVDLFINPSYLKVNANLSSNDVCFIGPHLNTYKGVDILVDVFSQLPDQKRQLYLIGTVQNSTINEKIKGKNNIHVTKRVSNPANYLKKCGLYINLARFDPAGINILEAMATGIPPIVSNMCGFSSVVKKISPKLVASLKKDEILKTILWLEKSPQKRELGKKAKVLAKKFTKSNSIEDFKKKIQKLIS